MKTLLRIGTFLLLVILAIPLAIFYFLCWLFNLVYEK
jgi:hypothetical protein